MDKHQQNVQRAKTFEGCEGVPPNAAEELELMKADLEMMQSLLVAQRKSVGKKGRRRGGRSRKGFSRLDLMIPGRMAFRKRGPF